MLQVRKFRSNFENVSCDIRESVSRLFRKCNLFSFKFVRHLYKCRLVLFSRQIVARFSQDCRATVVGHSRDIHTSVAKISHCKFAKISHRQVRDTRTNVPRPSHGSLVKYFGEKIRIKFLNMFKNFATQENSHECRAKVRDKICKTVARNSHASEILA